MQAIPLLSIQGKQKGRWPAGNRPRYAVGHVAPSLTTGCIYFAEQPVARLPPWLAEVRAQMNVPLSPTSSTRPGVDLDDEKMSHYRRQAGDNQRGCLPAAAV